MSKKFLKVIINFYNILLLFIFVVSSFPIFAGPASERFAKSAYSSINKDSYCLVANRCLSNEAKKNWVFKHFDKKQLGKFNSWIEILKINDDNYIYHDLSKTNAKQNFQEVMNIFSKKLKSSSWSCSTGGISDDVELLKLCVAGVKDDDIKNDYKVGQSNCTNCNVSSGLFGNASNDSVCSQLKSPSLNNTIKRQLKIEAKRRGLDCRLKDFNKFSKVTFSIKNKTFTTIIGYYENYKINPKKAYAKFNLNNDLCVGNVTIENESSFRFTCKSGYSANGLYFPSRKSVNAMGKGKDSDGNEFMFRIHGQGTSTKQSYLASIKNLEDIPNINRKIKNKITNKTIDAENKCTEIGFTKGTIEYGKCVLKLLDLK